MFKGIILKERRIQAGYTLHGLSRALREQYGETVAVSTLNNWELSSGAKPTRTKLNKICKVLDLSIEDLYEEPNQMSEMDRANESSAMEIIERFIQIYKKNPIDERIEKVRTILF